MAARHRAYPTMQGLRAIRPTAETMFSHGPYPNQVVHFDSPDIATLVERARSPLDTGVVNAEVIAALTQEDLSPRDRGQLLLAQLVLLQGSLSATEAAAQVAEAIELLRHNDADVQSLLSAVAISATLAAAAGDHATCLENCLTLSGIVRANPADGMSFRAAANFGAALMVLGAYDLAAPLFMSAIQGSLDRDDMIGVVVSCANLVMAVSRQSLVNGHARINEPIYRMHLELIEGALHEVSAKDPAQEMRAFVQAVLANCAQLRGDTAVARAHWGDLDALTAHPSESFTQYLCLVEAPLAIEAGDIERAHVLIAEALDHKSTPHIVPLGRVDALKLRSKLHETTGDLAAALKDARDAVDLALHETSGFADLLISQIDKRAALEHNQQALLDQATHLSEQALVDELTQIGNRRAYELRLDSLRGSSHGAIAVLLCDIDGFKEVNDQYGHTFGDQVIARAGSLLSNAYGAPDGVFRYGGDEFVVLARYLSQHDATELAEHVRASFENELWAVDGKIINGITCSIGLWVGEAQDIMLGLAQADACLYDAKRAGRNKIAISGAAEPAVAH